MQPLDPAVVARLRVNKPSAPSAQDIMSNPSNQLIASLAGARMALYADYFLDAAGAANVSVETQDFVQAMHIMMHASLDEGGKRLYAEAKKLDAPQSAEQVYAAVTFLRRRIQEQRVTNADAEAEAPGVDDEGKYWE